MSWKISIQGSEYEAADVQELKEWFRLGRLPRDAYVFHPVLQRWMYPAELEELKDVSPGGPPPAMTPPPKQSSSILNTRVSGCTGCLILLAALYGIGFLLWFFAGSSTNSSRTGSSQSSPPPRAWSSSDDPNSLPASGPIRNLHNLKEVTTVGKKHLIERWRWERGSSYVYLEPGVWNSLSSAQQRQLLDQIANSTFMDGLINMWLYVGATEVGRIKPRMSGGFEFVPAGR